MKQSNDRSHQREQQRRPLPFPEPSNPAFRNTVKRRLRRHAGDAGLRATNSLNLNIVAESAANGPLQLGDLLSPKFLRKQSGFLISFILHLFLLFLLSVVLIQVGTGQPLLILEALVVRPEMEVDELEVDFNVIGEQDPLNLAGLDDELGDFDLQHEIVEPDVSRVAEEVSETGRGRFKTGNGKSTEFFGTKIEGKSFVYVIDRSGSMAYTPQKFKAQSQSTNQVTRFKAASAELMRSIGQLTEDQEFYVVMFSNQSVRMFDDKSALPKPIIASAENKLRLKEWLDNLNIAGGTDPRNSLDLALKMQPDAIFMLSDGEFGAHVAGSADGSLEIVKNNNIGKVPIHTIALEDDVSKKNMAEIAEVSGGEFRFVTIYSYLLSQLASTDSADQINALDYINSLNQIDWTSRIQLANQAIDILASANPETQSHASEVLHWLSFKVFKNQIAPITSQDQQETVGRSTQQWKKNWEQADRLVKRIRDGEISAKLSKSEPPEQLALAIYGDFARHKALTQVREMTLTLPDAEQRENIAGSLKIFQARYAADDPFVLIGLPSPTKKAAALNQLLQTPLSWPERYEIVNSHILPLLDGPDETNREFAENALHELTFELFRSPIVRSLSDQSAEERKALSAKWKDFWSQMNNVSKISDRDELAAENLSFECLLMHAYANFRETNNISPVINLANSELTTAKRVKLVKSLFAFQTQYGVTRESQDALIKVCCELARFSKKQQLSWSYSVSLRNCKACLEKTLRKRNYNARKMYRSIMKTTEDGSRRLKIKRLLLEQYPDTKYAQLVSDEIP